MRREGPFDPELAALLERGRTIPRVPDVVRRRALARARAGVAAAGAVPGLAVPPPARGRRLRFALAAGLAFAVGGAGAASALLNREQGGPERAEAAKLPEEAPAPTPTSNSIPAAPTVAPPVRIAKPARAARLLTPQESYAAELTLLQQAQTAYGDQRFASALTLLSEHGRRFPNGRLAEEREALRVRSLAASGRTDEASRAAASFASRFPRSVLLPRLQRAATGAD